MKRYIKSSLLDVASEDWLTRFEIAKSPDTDINTLKQLSTDDSPLVRLGVYNNPNITPEIRELLLQERLDIYSAKYQIYCRGDISDKEKITNIVEQALNEIAICTTTPYVSIPKLSVAKDTLSIAGNFDTINLYEYEAIDYTCDALTDSGYHIINFYLLEN